MTPPTPAAPAPSETSRAVDMWIGIDPGLTGAIAVIHVEGHAARPWIRSTPIITDARGRRDFDRRSMAEVLYAFPRAFVAIEKVYAMPAGKRKQGAQSSFGFGAGYGLWLGILTAWGMPYVEVYPQSWKARLGLKAFGTGKDASVRYAKAIDPTLNLRPTLRSRVDSHGFADAFCLAVYARSEWRTLEAVRAASGSLRTGKVPAVR